MLMNYFFSFSQSFYNPSFYIFEKKLLDMDVVMDILSTAMKMVRRHGKSLLIVVL